VRVRAGHAGLRRWGASAVVARGDGEAVTMRVEHLVRVRARVKVRVS
jgi:hypothetical protein